MPFFLPHSLDCSEVGSCVEASHVLLLEPAPDGWIWTEAPSLAAWTPVPAGDGFSLIPKERPLSYRLQLAASEKKALVKVKREQVEYGGCWIDLGSLGNLLFDTDPDSQRKVNGAVVMAMIMGSEFTITWRLGNNATVELNAEQMAYVGQAIGQHVAASQYRKNTLDAAINAAVVAEDEIGLNSIDVNSGWP